jgi:dTDP-4-amino-4,6-dideoxygalactose transaminase
MNDIAASIGIANLPNIDNIVAAHHKNDQLLHSKLELINGLTLMQKNEDYYYSSWVKTLLVERRDDFIVKMKEHGIGVSKVHGRNDKHDCVAEFRSLLPTTDYISDTMCCIPCGWWLTEDDCQYIVDVISKGW